MLRAVRWADDDVRRAAAALLGRSVTAVEVSAEAIDPHLRLHSVTGGVHRVRGTADGEPFGCVVKVTQQGEDEDPQALWVSGGDEAHRNYWKREYLAFASGLLGSLPGRLRAPRLLHAAEPDERTGVLWLEEVVGRTGDRFQPQHLARAARDLATTQGAYAAGTVARPDQPWLSRDWLADWVAAAQRWWPLVDDDGAWEDRRHDGALAPFLPLRDRAREVWAERERLLDVVRAAPQTVVHLDLWPTNLFAADDGSTVAIDWSSVGLGALAQDLDQTTLDPVWMQVQPGGDLDLPERAVLPSYAWGLREAGVAVGDGELRRWYAAAAGLRYVSMLGAQADLAADDERVAAQERRWDRPFAAIQADRARVVERCLDLATEALA